MISTLLTALGCFLAGAFAWTFAEYGMHNWRGHHGKGRNTFSREHLKHHAETHYFTPTRLKLQMALQALVVAVPVALIVAGLVVGGSFMLGFTLGWVGYEVLHRRIHTHPPRGPYSRWARKHHYLHHFRRPNHNHGVTSPLWDVVFRTWESTADSRIRVPRKHAMSWLVDEATDEVYPHLADDYELVGRATRRAAPARSDRSAPAPAPEAATCARA